MKQELELIEQWKKLADNLIVYAEEIKATVKNQALYGAVCEDIEKYKKLKELTNLNIN